MQVILVGFKRRFYVYLCEYVNLYIYFVNRLWLNTEEKTIIEIIFLFILLNESYLIFQGYLKYFNIFMKIINLRHLIIIIIVKIN
jgi:hypothetical protein